MQKKALRFTDNWVYVLLVVLSFVLYGNTIFNNYGFDDAFVVKGNKYVQKGTEGIQELFDMPYAEIGSMKLDKRPIPLISFAVEHQLFGDNPHVSHFFNVLLYALTLIVLYVVLKRVFHLDKVYFLLPLCITVFYAAHPIHTEVVCSLKNRDEIMVMLFGLLFIWFGYNFCYKQKWKWVHFVLSMLFLTMLLMSKISGVIFIGIFFLLFIYHGFFKQNKWNTVIILCSIALMIRAVLVVFDGVSRINLDFENPLASDKSLMTHLGTACYILVYHVKMLVFPKPLLFYYGANMFPLVKLWHPLALISFVFHLALLIFGFFRFFKKDVLGLVILCYFISIVLFSNFPVPYTSMFAERTLFVSSLWFISIVAIALIYWFNKMDNFKNKPYVQNGTGLIFISLFVLYSFMTINRNFYWKNSITLMEKDIKHLDKSIMANYIYANNLKYESKISKDSIISRYLAEKAVYHFEKTVKLSPNYPEFHFKLGSAYKYNLKNTDSAELYFGNAVLIDSLYADANFELSKLFFEKNDFQNSYRFFANTYKLQPKDSMTLFYYAQSAAKVGDMQTCFRVNQEFLKLYPNLYYPYLNLGVYYSTMLKDDSAVVYLNKAVELGYREPDLINKLILYYQKNGNTTKAEYLKSIKF